MALVLPDALVEFAESGVSIIVGSRDANNRPECLRGLGARVAADRQTIAIFLGARLSVRMQSDLADNARIAVAFTRIIDHRSVQLKGRVVDVRPMTADDEMVQQRYISAFAEAMSYAGLPRSVVRSVIVRPGVGVVFEVDELFHQTPGPGAGRRIETFA